MSEKKKEDGSTIFFFSNIKKEPFFKRCPPFAVFGDAPEEGGKELFCFFIVDCGIQLNSFFWRKKKRNLREIKEEKNKK